MQYKKKYNPFVTFIINLHSYNYYYYYYYYKW
jgi:hypothetical protein